MSRNQVRTTRNESPNYGLYRKGVYVGPELKQQRRNPEITHFQRMLNYCEAQLCSVCDRINAAKAQGFPPAGMHPLFKERNRLTRERSFLQHKLGKSSPAKH